MCASQHNAYVYSNNNPMTFADPSGLAYEECFSGQYSCTYGPGRSLDKVEYGKNYEKVTKNLGGTLAPRYVRYRTSVQKACANDPGCPSWNGSHTAEAKRQARLKAQRETVRQERLAAIAQQRNAQNEADLHAGHHPLRWPNIAVTYGSIFADSTVYAKSSPGNIFAMLSTHGSNQMMKHAVFSVERAPWHQTLINWGGHPWSQFAARGLLIVGAGFTYVENYHSNGNNGARAAVQTGAQVGTIWAGAKVGASIGAMAGSFIPGVGTGAGGIAGGVLGAGAGVVASFSTGELAGRVWDWATGWW